MSEEDKNKPHQLKNTISDQENDLNLKHLFDTADQDKDGLILESELKMLMTNLEINKETYDTVMKQITPAGMDYKTFSSLIGSPVKSILKVVYEDNGKQGLKMMYKLMGYEYVENKQQQQQKKEIEKKKRQALLKKRYPESEYDKSNPSKTRYRCDYKPEHPRPVNGVHFYDSIWDFNNK